MLFAYNDVELRTSEDSVKFGDRSVRRSDLYPTGFRSRQGYAQGGEPVMRSAGSREEFRYFAKSRAVSSAQSGTRGNHTVMRRRCAETFQVHIYASGIINIRKRPHCDTNKMCRDIPKAQLRPRHNKYLKATTLRFQKNMPRHSKRTAMSPAQLIYQSSHTATPRRYTRREFSRAPSASLSPAPHFTQSTDVGNWLGRSTSDSALPRQKKTRKTKARESLGRRSRWAEVGGALRTKVTVTVASREGHRFLSTGLPGYKSTIR